MNNEQSAMNNQQSPPKALCRSSGRGQPMAETMNNKPGFTLMEMLITIAVLGVISGVVVALLNPVKHMQTSRDSRRKSDLGAIQTALEMYYSENNQYPSDGGVPFGSSWSNYMRQVPQDPSSGQSYCFDALSGRQQYRLCANMETTEMAGPSGTCRGSSYNYCVENPF